MLYIKKCQVLTYLKKKFRSLFEFPFIIAVKGLSKNVIISEMEKSINSTKEKEFKTAMKEINKIA